MLSFEPGVSVAGELVVAALFLAMVANRLVEGLIKPIFERFGWDKLALMYLAWLVGAGLVFAARINLFATYLPDPLTGQILSAVVAGGGANLINDIFGSLGMKSVGISIYSPTADVTAERVSEDAPYPVGPIVKNLDE